MYGHIYTQTRAMYVLVSEGELKCVREIHKFMKKAIGRIRDNEKGKRTRESEHVGICECRTIQKAQNTLKQKNSVRWDQERE